MLAVWLSVAATPAAAQVGAPAAVAGAPALVTAASPQAATPEATRKRHHAKGDPLEGFNRVMFSVHQFFDRLLFRPVAKAYEKVLPRPVRKGLHHFFVNLQEPAVFVNDVLQLKPKRALRTFARFSINSTIGVAGVLDVAKGEGVGLEHHDNSFGDTLGRYGVGPGPYLFLPFFGPSDFRDFAGAQADDFALRFGIGSPYDRAEYVVTSGVTDGLDLRVESDDELKALLAGAVDPYATLRSTYLQDRAATIAELRGRAAAGSSALDDPLTDPAADPGAATAPGTVPAAAAPAAPVIDPITTPPPGVTLPTP